MPPSHPFDFGERLGLFLIVESASLSAIAVSVLLTYVAYRLLKRYRSRVALRKWSAQAELGLPIYESDASDSSFFIGLMTAELVQATGGLLNIKWMRDAYVTEGPLCTAQGILKQFGDVSVAFMSLTIAIHTFSVLVVRWHPPKSISKYIIGSIFTSIALVMGISAAALGGKHGKGRYYGDTTLWCWIRPEYRTERIVFEYLWMWIAASIMTTIYGVIALVMRGILVIEDRKCKFYWRKSSRNLLKDRIRAYSLTVEEEDEEEKQSKAIANLMFFYPAVYIFCIVPVSLVRWLDFRGHYVPPAATIFASIVFSMSGLLNSILYAITRPELVIGNTHRVNTGENYEMGSNTGGGSHSVSKREVDGRYIRHHLGHLPDIDASSYSGNTYTNGREDGAWMQRETSLTSPSNGEMHLATPSGYPTEYRIDIQNTHTTSGLYLNIPPSHHGLHAEPSWSDEIGHRKLISIDTGHPPDNIDLDTSRVYGAQLTNGPPHL